MDLKTFRKQSKMTLDEMGQRLGVTGATVQRWERGKMRMPLNAAVIIYAMSDGQVTHAELDAAFSAADAAQMEDHPNAKI